VAFEAKVDEVTAILENLSDTDWRKTTAAAKWTVAATAHHVASSYEHTYVSGSC
jgi:N6-adenosine-specific RNA methylase IME4